MRILTSTFLGSALVALTAISVFAAGPTSTSVRSFADGSVVAGSSASVVRSGAGVSATLSTERLSPGDVVTMWWIVFNHPENCAGPSSAHPFQCGASDLGNPAVEASVLFATGRVISETGSGDYGAHLSVGDTRGALFGPGLLLPKTAHIHLVLRDHGAADPSRLGLQLHSYDVCSPTCVNVQFAVFQS
jgi:hypothetical protein